MFNRAPFNRIRFNHAYTPPTLDIAAIIIEATNAFAGPGHTLAASVHITEMHSGTARISWLMPIAGALMETISGRAASGLSFITAADLSENLNGFAHSSMIFFMDCDVNEILVGTAPAAIGYYLDAALSESIIGYASSGYAYILPACILYERQSGHASGYNYEEIILEFTGELPPGGTLIVDSDMDVLDVILNHASALHSKAGKWIYIDRKTMDIAIQHTTGDGVEYEVTYYDMYL